MVVCASYVIRLCMCELALNPIGGVAHFIEASAARRARCMRAIYARPPQRFKRLPEGGGRHRLIAIIPMGKRETPFTGDSPHGAQYIYRLTRQRNRMIAAFLHARRWNSL